MFSCFKDFYYKIIDNKNLLFYSLFWVLFITFFTYTMLYHALMKVGVSFVAAYYDDQYRFLSLFVNLGLVCMLTFDYGSIKRPLDYKYIVIPLVLVLMAVAIMAHAYAAHFNYLTTFVCPINWPFLGILVHGLFLIGLWWLKFNVVIESIAVGELKGEVKTK